MESFADGFQSNDFSGEEAVGEEGMSYIKNPHTKSIILQIMRFEPAFKEREEEAYDLGEHEIYMKEYDCPGCMKRNPWSHESARDWYELNEYLRSSIGSGGMVQTCLVASQKYFLMMKKVKKARG